MALEQLKVREIVKQSVSKNMDIPEFQREFVWDAEQVKKLVESLYRDYPIGSFLLWDASQYEEAKTAKGTQGSLWIVDGQQRTTALCLLLGMRPYWWPVAQDWNKALERYDVMVNLAPDGETNRLEFALPNPIRRQDPRWMPVRQILSKERVEDLTSLSQDMVKRVVSDPGEIMALFGNVHARVQRVWQIRERDIPVIKIGHEVEDVAEIFARLNQAGTRVKEADVILALAAVRNPGWVRESYLPYRNDLEDRGWDLDPGIFIRAMTSIGRGRARLIEVPREFWNPGNLPLVWGQTQEAMSRVLKRLAGFGVLCSDLLPSTNSLIPLILLEHRWGGAGGYQFGKALYWFLLANRDGRYSGSAITSLNEDARAITEAESFQQAVVSLQAHLEVKSEVAPEDFLDRYDRAGNRFMRLMLYLVLFDRGASDWVDKTRLGYDKTGSPIATDFEPQWHHVFPRGMLRKAGLKDDEIHTLANITVLNERTNVNKLAGKPPWRYIEQFAIQEESLRCHLIPESFIGLPDTPEHLRKLWDVDRYTDFLIERAQLLAHGGDAFLKRIAQG